MTTFNVPMHRAVSIIFMLCVALVTGVVVWCFRSGFLWSGICTIAVAGPLTLMYWYMLLINPARAFISVSEEGIVLDAPPFSKFAVEFAAITSMSEMNMKTDESLSIHKLEGAIRFGKYRNGRFTLKDERAAVILTNSNRVLALETEDKIYLLGPSEFDAFVEAVKGVQQ